MAKSLTGIEGTKELEECLWQWRYGLRPQEPMFPSTEPGGRQWRSPLGGLAVEKEEKKR